MKYERRFPSENEGFFLRELSSLSCAFQEYRRSMRNDFLEDMPGEFRDQLWRALCVILTASETRPVLVPTTDRETEWLNLLYACPYAQLVSEVKSRHGNYNAQIWIFQVHERNS